MTELTEAAMRRKLKAMEESNGDPAKINEFRMALPEGRSAKPDTQVTAAPKPVEAPKAAEKPAKTPEPAKDADPKDVLGKSTTAKTGQSGAKLGAMRGTATAKPAAKPTASK